MSPLRFPPRKDAARPGVPGPHGTRIAGGTHPFGADRHPRGVLATGSVALRDRALRPGVAGGRLAARTASERRRPAMADGPWFWCMKHNTVEPREGCAERHRLGPYETREEAEHALQSVAEREARLSAEDQAWEEGRPQGR